MDFYRASNSPSWERLWKALYVEDGTVTDAPSPPRLRPLVRLTYNRDSIFIAAKIQFE
jgi:hypothetical protein